MRLTIDEPSILVFDMEARPTAWIGGDYVGRTMTAYACSYLDSEFIESDVIAAGDYARWKDMVTILAENLEHADIVVGHYIRGFDLPLLNADLERIGAVSLPRLLALDTKIDRKQGNGLSESLENLLARYDLPEQKMSMKEPWWEEFNLWQTERTRTLVRERVESDVAGTKALYRAMIEADRLKEPKAWDPTSAKIPRYRG